MPIYMTPSAPPTFGNNADTRTKTEILAEKKSVRVSGLDVGLLPLAYDEAGPKGAAIAGERIGYCK